MFSEREKYYRRISYGEVLKFLREKADYKKQYQFAKELGIEQSLYSSYENGANITRDQLEKILDFLCVTLGEYGTLVDNLTKAKLEKKEKEKNITITNEPIQLN